MVHVLEPISEEDDENLFNDIENGKLFVDVSNPMKMDSLSKDGSPQSSSPQNGSPRSNSLKTSREKGRYEEKKYEEPEQEQYERRASPRGIYEDCDDHSSASGGSDKAVRRRGVTFSHETSLSEKSFLQELERKESRLNGDTQAKVRTNSTMDFALLGRDDINSMQFGRDRSGTVQGRDRSGTVQGRDRSGTVQGRDRSSTVQGRDRSGTEIKGRERSGTEFLDISVFENAGIKPGEYAYNKLMIVVDFLMTSDLSWRPQLYFIFIIFVSLMLVADNTRSAFAWYRFCGVVIIVDIITAILDHLFFVFIIDKIFSKQYNVAYMIKGFHGPLGLLATLLIVSSSLSKILELTDNFALWRNYVSAMITVLIFVCIKNWFIRKHYTKLLNNKFSDRVFQLQTWRILLSELATTKPPKVVKISIMECRTSIDICMYINIYTYAQI